MIQGIGIYFAIKPNMIDKKKILGDGVKKGQIPEHLYMYSSIDSAKKILENPRLWMSPFDSFNDPFEFSFTLNNDYTQEEFIQWFCAAKKGSSKEQSIMAKELFSNKDKIDNIIKECIKKDIKDYGIKCFTTSPNNLLMWAHYAKDHQGVCFKFDILKDADFFQDLLRVKYDDTYVQLNYIKSPRDTIEVLRSKSNAWQYEEEWRVLKSGKAKKFVDISPDSLVEIIFGCRCKCDTQDAIQKLCSQKGFKSVQFSKAEKKSDAYKIIINPLVL